MSNYPAYWAFTMLWQNATDMKIRAFARLQAGWRFGSGESFSPSVLENARQINQKATDVGFFKTDAFPGKNGDVSVVIYDNDNRYDFRVRPNSIQFTHEKNDETIQEGVVVSIDESLNLISNLKAEKWKRFYTSIFAITKKISADFDQKPLRVQATEVEYPLSPKNVFWQRRDVYVAMPYNTIQGLSPSQLCSGSLDRWNYLPAAPSFHRAAPLETTATQT